MGDQWLLSGPCIMMATMDYDQAMFESMNGMKLLIIGSRKAMTWTVKMKETSLVHRFRCQAMDRWLLLAQFLGVWVIRAMLASLNGRTHEISMTIIDSTTRNIKTVYIDGYKYH